MEEGRSGSLFDELVPAFLAGFDAALASPKVAAVPAELMLQPKPVANVVPGKVHCAKCGFTLVRTNLYVNSGTTGPGGEETEPCPNDGNPLLPVTWEAEARSLGELAERLFDRAIAAEKKLEAGSPSRRFDPERQAMLTPEQIERIRQEVCTLDGCFVSYDAAQAIAKAIESAAAQAPVVAKLDQLLDDLEDAVASQVDSWADRAMRIGAARAAIKIAFAPRATPVVPMDCRCAACDKPAVRDSQGTYPTCPCGSRQFNATLGAPAANAKPLTEG